MSIDRIIREAAKHRYDDNPWLAYERFKKLITVLNMGYDDYEMGIQRLEKALFPKERAC